MAMGIGQPMQTREPTFPNSGPLQGQGQMTHPLLGNFPTMNPQAQMGMGQMGPMGMGGPGGPGGMMTPQMLASQPIGSAQMGAFSNEPGISSQPPMATGAFEGPMQGGHNMMGANVQMFTPFQR